MGIVADREGFEPLFAFFIDFLHIFGIILSMISIFGNILRDFGLGFLVNSLFHLSLNGYSDESLYLVIISSLLIIEGIFLQNWSKLWTFKA